MLVNGWCGPVRDHCEDSGGGLWYRGPAEFGVALERLLDDPGLRDRLARAGGGYVRREYGWPAVRRRYDALLDRIAASA